MRKLQSKKGFTLAELLIVVAIIAILVAIGIPAFSTAMERSRETVDLSNIRGAYAEFMASSLGSNEVKSGYYKLDIKQRDCTKWVVDVSGFLSNLNNGTTMPTRNLKNGECYAKFSVDSTTGDAKPKLDFVTAAPSSGIINSDATAGWWLTSGT